MSNETETQIAAWYMPMTISILKPSRTVSWVFDNAVTEQLKPIPAVPRDTALRWTLECNREGDFPQGETRWRERSWNRPPPCHQNKKATRPLKPMLIVPS